ncbi:c-type cytochrome [Riemerella anatipestifer]|uniref:Cytochrome c class i n=1 Tax=Riemerella anatipestifer (strain ATCC 11845 / DSM 15868 / JCM 9532 / NCTC 11014) TaxID=693978 RepID=E4TCZ0_RIEAD|nr:c-type cytochrome [Riemerella anatipestifer]ADQ82649.1 cytochrome c class I [Riemerella anatipestifer ATCC 11845 = DSM 15868]ADZ11861.1 cytochrome c oxidase, cbb3-type, subunit III [Riemerella anatipestifer RA-GD]AFD56659.1 cytochrome c class i [Riemerella anatipestifer ATCC 11845 = DSM 15868]EFT37056.1 Cytochrome c oxidase subunit CcoP [Riemerella anatipestifer RA-YM]MBT0525968.1 c-type cytochrome [Riemerella anatipestifer]
MKQRTPVYVNILVILTILFIVYYMFVQNASFITSPYFWGTVVISVILAMIHGAIGDLIENQNFAKLSDEAKKAYLEEKKIPYWKRLWDSAFKKQSVSEEKDIIIDHGFDGIMELDNQLPKWWLGLFWLGFAYLVIYIVAFSFTDFAHPDKEYEVEHKEQLASIEQWMKDTPPPTIDNAVYSADNIAEGEEIFKTNCVSCHGDGGRGGIGPNLTDNHWINHTENSVFRQIFYMVENGSPNNPAMQAFGKNGILTGFDIEKVAAYVYHINQEKAPITQSEGGAIPQGDEVEWEN